MVILKANTKALSTWKLVKKAEGMELLNERGNIKLWVSMIIMDVDGG
jgi:hypothetical protein